MEEMAAVRLNVKPELSLSSRTPLDLWLSKLESSSFRSGRGKSWTLQLGLEVVVMSGELWLWMREWDYEWMNECWCSKSRCLLAQESVQVGFLCSNGDAVSIYHNGPSCYKFNSHLNNLLWIFFFLVHTSSIFTGIHHCSHGL